ncbi:MAG TPA: alanine--glyoxylate aminotransferase family protein [Anaerolineales bacterium]|nr:alanine--glyoxylate aminotransferase family protein [Anaerolineales bacterium]
MAHLFIPGPTDVAPEILAAQTHRMIGHRSPACSDLFARIQPRLRRIFQTDHRVFVTASSGSGLQEGSLRNTVRRRALVCVGGAFAERWFEIARANGLEADRLDVPWGQAHDPEQVAEAIGRKDYDAVAIVHNESSTGVENPVGEIAAAIRQVSPDTLILVDAVSSAGGVEIATDAWGLDVVLTSSQKCFALPPGLAFAAVSDRTLERASGVPHRGWYFDFLLLERYLQQSNTPATPAISLLYALDAQLDRMLAEGLEARFTRHRRMAEITQTWALDRLGLLAPPPARSKTVTTVLNDRGLDLAALNAHLAAHGMAIAAGYGNLRDRTFRIGHMGEIQPGDVEQLLALIDDFLAGAS